MSASTPGVVFEDLLIIGSTVSETLPGVARRHSRVRHQDRRAALELSHDSASGRVRLRDVAAGRVEGDWRRERVGGRDGRSRSARIVFAATGSASFDFYGANRIGDNLFANTLLALDARTGKRIWHFQGVKHDLWDWDFPAAPALVTVTRDGRAVDAVAQITKTGYVYVFERETGKPLFPIEYRKVPASTLDGERAAETQPYPVSAAAVHAADAHRGHAHDAHARRACGGAQDVPRVQDERDVRAAEHAGHDHLPRRRRRRRVGRSGVRSGDGAAVRERERDAVVPQARAAQRPVALRRRTARAVTATISRARRTFRRSSASATRRTREQLAQVIREGTGRMPAFRRRARQRAR